MPAWLVVTGVNKKPEIITNQWVLRSLHSKLEATPCHNIVYFVSVQARFSHRAHVPCFASYRVCSPSPVAAGRMDANELSDLLEDVREYMKYVATGNNSSVLDTIKNVAAENTAACSAIGHIIEQYLMKVWKF